MRSVFADTLYWIAVVIPGDQWHGPATRAHASLGAVRLLTTDEVLGEVLTLLSRGGERIRQLAVNMVRAILSDPNVRVLHQSRESFLGGVRLYADRRDKTYSLTDCISMNAMRSADVMEILTNDRHFEQEGFRVLISQSGDEMRPTLDAQGHPTP